jgi:hypothetical protein
MYKIEYFVHGVFFEKGILKICGGIEIRFKAQKYNFLNRLFNNITGNLLLNTFS